MRKVPEGLMVKPPLTAVEIRALKRYCKDHRLLIREAAAEAIRYYLEVGGNHMLQCGHRNQEECDCLEVAQ